MGAHSSSRRREVELMVKVERRQLTPRELAQITSSRPVVRCVLCGRRENPRGPARIRPARRGG